ncbi:putative N6-adenine-specific DNA methylase [Fibrobacter sp. UWT3]|uniref:THUMP domain-containing class I SAM-dependent RNA methyltransferase n=1 Tax=Fibrobacter sp. UWT3 TaxID=1896225 RepID=UPI000BCA8D15|nr:RNA methyltransferase [Fibrobacter sp. UWT3]SOE56685.1 putative N6-adenine-specific DNA methylase [Fibrobacter sp. UWT3]
MDSTPEKNSAFEKRLKRQVIGKPHRFLAVVPLGFEQTLVREMQNSVTFHVVGDGKVEFTEKLVEAWKIAAYSRIANRILMHIADFKAENFRELEKKTAEVPWELFLDDGGTEKVDIHVTCKHSRLYHSDAVAERIGKFLPSPSTPQYLYVTLIDDRCTLWLDLAGEELYKRGHERFVNDAPLKETIAAAMLFEAISISSSESSNISHSTFHIALIDPMAGSGTFSLEAAYMASGLIPGKCRDFALKHQPAFKPATWKHIVSSMDSLAPTGLRNDNKKKQVPTDVTPKRDATIVTPKREAQVCPIAKIITSDISEHAVNIIRHNVECSPGVQVNPQVHDFFTYTAQEIADACCARNNASIPATSDKDKHATRDKHAASDNDTQPVIVLNPPYGKRLDFDAPALYTRIGKKLAELARELEPFGKKLTVAILAPNDDPRPGSKFTCTANLLRECPALDPQRNPSARRIATSHGGLGLGAFIAQI